MFLAKFFSLDVNYVAKKSKKIVDGFGRLHLFLKFVER